AQPGAQVAGREPARDHWARPRGERRPGPAVALPALCVQVVPRRADVRPEQRRREVQPRADAAAAAAAADDDRRRGGARPGSPRLRSRLGVPGAIAVVAGLLGIAAAQPVISGTRTRVGRSDAEVYVLFDTSRSMLARRSPGSSDRLERSKRLALHLRQSLADVPFGIASLTDRMLPHLFPTLDGDVFASTLRDAIGIERPPPSGTEALATDYNALGDAADGNYYRASVKKRPL